jgi:uncharacterized membrane protein YhaH (DUF805 family)
MNIYIEVLKKFKDFAGRASRKEYWVFSGINILINIVLGIIEGSVMEEDNKIFESIFSLILLIPSLAVSVRRVHDVNKSGWFLLIPFYNLYLLIISGDKEPNNYGDVPEI